MEMHQIRYFLAVARTGNFTRAAEQCNVTQPSLTRAIQQLEQEFGGDLFRRERPHAQLTELGQRLLPPLQQCYDSASSASSLASQLKKRRDQRTPSGFVLHGRLRRVTPLRHRTAKTLQKYGAKDLARHIR